MKLLSSAFCGVAAVVVPFMELCTTPPPPVIMVSNQYQPAGFEAGMAVLLYKRDFTDLEDLGWKLDLLFGRLIGLRVNAISIAWPIYTQGVRSNKVSRGQETPSDESLGFFIKKATERGFLVTLKPILDERVLMASGKYEWRGTIRPSKTDVWFENYTALMVEYASLGQAAGADIFVVATELDSMEKHSARWRKSIAEIRTVFNGRLTYSSNQGVSAEMPWDALDFIGVDAFFPLNTASKNATTADMVKAWQVWVQEVEQRSVEVGKPVVFTEIGSKSQKDAHKRPWLWNPRGVVDLENQRRYYEAACIVWRFRIRGIYWWNTTLWMTTKDPLKDKSFLPFGKPAEAEIANCYK